MINPGDCLDQPRALEFVSFKLGQFECCQVGSWLHVRDSITGLGDWVWMPSATEEELMQRSLGIITVHHARARAAQDFLEITAPLFPTFPQV